MKILCNERGNTYASMRKVFWPVRSIEFSFIKLFLYLINVFSDNFLQNSDLIFISTWKPNILPICQQKTNQITKNNETLLISSRKNSESSGTSSRSSTIVFTFCWYKSKSYVLLMWKLKEQFLFPINFHPNTYVKLFAVEVNLFCCHGRSKTCILDPFAVKV